MDTEHVIYVVFWPRNNHSKIKNYFVVKTLSRKVVDFITGTQ